MAAWQQRGSSAGGLNCVTTAGVYTTTISAFACRTYFRAIAATDVWFRCRGAPQEPHSLLASGCGIEYPTMWKSKGAKIAAMKEDMLARG